MSRPLWLERVLLGALLIGCGPAVETQEETEGTAGETSSDASDSGGPEPVACGSDGDEPGGTLLWSDTRSRYSSGEFVVRTAIGSSGVVVAGTLAQPDGSFEETDVITELRAWDSGEVLWSDEYAGSAGHDETVTDVGIDHEGFVHVVLREVVARVQMEVGAAIDSRVVLLRYAPDGTRQWRYEVAREPLDGWDERYAWGWVGFGAAGEIRLFATDRGSFSEVESEVIELDRFGNEVRRYAPDLGFPARGVVDATFDSEGRLHIVASDNATIVMQDDVDGSLRWTVVDNGADYTPLGIDVAEDGTVHAYLGDYEDYANPIYFVATLDADGNVQEGIDIRSDGEPIDRLAMHCSGDVLVAGVGGLSEGEEGWTDTYTQRRGPDGAVKWSHRVDTGTSDSRSGFQVLSASPGGDVVVAKRVVDANGGALWIGRYAGG